MVQVQRFVWKSSIATGAVTDCGFVLPAENAVLYQNYKEKALDIDSDEESEPRGQKSDESIVVHPKPLRATWSQLSAVSACRLLCPRG